MTQQEIQPTYVTYNQSVWLKEKGFDEESKFIYAYMRESTLIDNIAEISNNNGRGYYLAPEQWQVVEWLRVNHGIEIEIIKDRTAKWSNNYYNYSIFKNDILIHERQLGGTKPNTPQEACSAAFDYIISNNLI